jgi:hypothetical protein
MFAYAEAGYNECGLVRKFIAEVVAPRVNAVLGPKGAHQRRTYRLLLERANFWLDSIDRLNKPGDVQAIASGARALFELVVDLTLLAHDPQGHPYEKFFSWEGSANFAADERMDKTFQETGVPPEVADVVAATRAVLAKERPSVLEARKKYWKGKHPPRWTGRHFDADVREADRLRGNRSLEQMYALVHARLCMNVHGSTLANLRSLDEEHYSANAGVGYSLIARFACDAAELVLRLVDAHDGEVALAIAHLDARRQELQAAVAR